MVQDESTKRRTQAAEEFNRHEKRRDGESVVGGLYEGLTVLRSLLYFRVHDDVERIVGTDSMWLPVSEIKTKRLARTQIELYEVAESAVAAREFGYVADKSGWFADWLAAIRPEDPGLTVEEKSRLADYLSQTADGRRLAFTDVLLKVLPESDRAPLVLFRLLPLSVQIVTAIAFGDRTRAAELRRRQVDLLSAICDCPECRAKVLDNGEQCARCGNPLWKTEWLAAD
jgi:hypothetical protein